MSRVVRFHEFGEPSVLRIEEQDPPIPDPGQVRVAVEFAGMNPVDSILRSGAAQGRLPISPPSTIGNEFAGVVNALGEGVANIAIGTAVFGAGPFRSMTDSLVTDARSHTVVPEGLDPAIASTLPVAGTTGLNSARSLNLTPEDTVLISAAAGGVGLIASQVALRAARR
jgi:NADPH:quinone reductase-like Zn-dependent oxidoreductase